MDQVTSKRIKRTQLILLLAALLLYFGGCGNAEESREDGAGAMAVSMSGGVDIDHFGSAEWTGGRIADTPEEDKNSTADGADESTADSAKQNAASALKRELSEETESLVYTGEDFVKSCVSIGAESIYLAGYRDTLEREASDGGKAADTEYFLGRFDWADLTLREFAIELPEDMCGYSGFVDEQGSWNLFLTQRNADGALTYEKSEIMVIGEDGKQERIIDISELISQVRMIPTWMTQDAQGNIYLSSEGKILIIDGEGNQRQLFKTGELWGFGLGRSGSVYGVFTDEDGQFLGRMDAETGAVEECARFSTELGAKFSALQSGTDTELLLANKGDGVWKYDGDSLELVLSTGELLGNGQDILGMGFGWDGRVLAMNYENRQYVFRYVPVEGADIR